MNSVKKQARVAGVLYLLASIPAPFCLIYVPSKLIVPGDATATADHVRASGTLLRFGIASELISSIVFIFVVLALYRLLKGVNKNHALAMVILLLVSIPISLLNVLNDIAALILVSGALAISFRDSCHSIGFHPPRLGLLTVYCRFRLCGELPYLTPFSTVRASCRPIRDGS